MKDYYKILQVSPDAAPEVIQMAYKALAKKYHPDLNPDRPDEAQEKMKELNEAFETLSDPEKRAKYNSSYHSAKQETPPPHEQQKNNPSTSTSEEPKPHTAPMESEPHKKETPPESKDDSSDVGTSIMFLLVDIFCLAIAGLVIFFAFKLGGFLLHKIFGGSSSSSSIVRNVEDESVEEQTEPLSYKWEQFSNYGNTYTLSENPYYLDGVSRYVDMVNQFYTSLQTSNSKQTVTQTTLEQALKDAGVSSSLIRGLSKKQNVDILQDSDFYRVDADTSNGLVATLFDGETERAYLEVSSTAKDAIGSDETVMFYYGDLKDNKPEGNGALFSYSKASGLALNYAGQFKEGKMSGKGVRFAHARLGYVLTEAGESEKNQLNGSGTQYRYEDSLVIYQLYQDKFAEYTNTILSTKSEDEANQLCEHILEKNPAVELFLTASNYDISRTTFDFNEAVICPYIEYKGDFKYAKYDGKGKFYAPGGWLAYDGAWTNGKYNGKGTLYNDDGSQRKKDDFDHEEIGDELTYVTLSYGVLDLYSNVNLDELFVTDVSTLSSDTSDTISSSSADNSTPESSYSPNDFAGYWFNSSSSDPYYMALEVSPSASAYIVEITICSDSYEWTATTNASDSLKFSYDNGFQQSYDETFNLPDLSGVITLDGSSHSVIWSDDSGYTINFIKSVSKNDFNSFLEKMQNHSASLTEDYNEPTSMPTEIAGHYLCGTNSNEAYINIYSSPDGDAVGNIEVYSQSGSQIFTATLYPTGVDNYDAFSNDGSKCHLYVYSDLDGSKDGFCLGAIPASEHLSFEGNYDITERYIS